MHTAWMAGALALTLVAPADAGPLADAIARHREADVVTLRAQLPGEPAVRCTLGAVYAARGDVSRAMLYLAGCDELVLPDDIAPAIVRATRQTRKAARASELTELHILSEPAGLQVALEALPGEPLVTPATVWIPAGTHTVRATAHGQPLQRSIDTKPYSRATLVLEPAARPAGPARAGRVDFEEDAGDAQAGPPPDVKRPSLLSNRYRGVAGPRTGPALDDPLAARGGPGARPWFGLRLGGGVFDDGARVAAVRPAVAVAARVVLTTRWFLAPRLDWTRRGGASVTPIDSVGASLGAGVTFVGGRGVQLAASGQLRGDVRFADAREAMTVARVGATAAAGLELAAMHLPFTAGVRVEHGLTALVGARDRAVLVELGVDWR